MRLKGAGFGYGIFGRFLRRMIDRENLREDNYPNLLLFTHDMFDMTDNFTSKLDCKAPALRAKRGGTIYNCESKWLTWIRMFVPS